MSAPVRLEVDRAGGVVVDAPAGLLSARDLEQLAAVFDALRPTLVRTCSPPLPPRSTWPAAWADAHAERAAIAAEGGALDPEAVADADLRAAVARWDLDPLSTDGAGR